VSILRAVVDFLLDTPRVGGEVEARLNRWRTVPAADLKVAHGAARYVVVDTETTGLDLRRDQLIAVGAVGVAHGLLDFADTFERVLRQDQASADANILIHGIGGQTQLAGVDPRNALLDFLEYLGKAPLVAFRAEFDQTMLTRGVRAILGYPFAHPWIDLALLLPALFPRAGHASLDDWLEHFGLAGGNRHHALADAFATAQLLQITLAAADRVGMVNAAQLIAMQKAQRWLGKR
jgi:DNA polymerase-3 subunit epsilon